ncbi:MAG: alpha/beta hydrolase family protein [Pseudomonadota bacterium]
MPQYNLDIARTVLVGHSAGGHLALWAAVRGQLPADSQLHRDTPFVPCAVISLADVGDLKAFAPFVPVICGPGIIERLTGAPPPTSRDAYADISPAVLPAPEGHVVMISGILDRLVPPMWPLIMRGRCELSGGPPSSWSTFPKRATSIW